MPALSAAERRALRAKITLKQREAEDPLVWYKPGPSQQRCYESQVLYRLISGPNQCLAADSLIYDPEAGSYRCISEIDGAFHVLAYDGDGLVVAEAHQPFVKSGEVDLFRVTLIDENVFTCSHDHRILIIGEWWSVGDMLANREHTTVSSIVKSIVPAGRGPVWDFTVPQYENYWHAGCLHHNTGKTAHAVVECAALARGKHPYHLPLKDTPLEILVVVPSRAQAVGVWGERLLRKCRIVSKEQPDIWKFPLIPAREIKKVYNSSSGSGPCPGRIELKNGSNIHFAWSGDMDQWERIQGMMFDFIFRDEGSGTSKLGEELYLRLLSAQQNKVGAGGILWSATPTLINDEFEVYRKKCRAAEANYAEYFIAPHENPAIGKEVRERMRASLSEDAQRIRLDGDMSAMELASVYGKQWDPDKHVASVEYIPGPYDNIWVSMDPGYDHPWGTGIFAINRAEPRRLRVLAYLWNRRITRRENVQFVADWLKGRKVEGVVVDPASYKTESNGKSLYTQIAEDMDELGIFSYRGLMTSRNRHEGGIELMQQYFLDGLVIFNPSCGQAISEVVGYRGRPETQFTGAHGVVKKNDEFPDLCRYLIQHEPTWVERPANLVSVDYAAAALQTVDVDALADTMADDLPEEAKLHMQRLRQSARLFDQTRKKTAPSFGTGTLNI